MLKTSKFWGHTPLIKGGAASRRGPIDTGVRHGWVASGDRFLGVHVHEPLGSARGATVVMAVPAGRDLVPLHRTVVHTARALAAQGWRVVRFDFSGTAQSPAVEEPAPAEVWLEDLRAVHKWAAPYGPVHAVGISVAGCILAADDAPWASRLVCAPVSGKQWVRHQSALRRMSGTALPPRQGPGTELLDLHLSDEGTAWLKTLPEPTSNPDRGLSVMDESLSAALPMGVHPREAEVAQSFTDAVVSTLSSAPNATAQRDAGFLPLPLETVTLTAHGAGVRVSRTRIGRDERPAMIVSPLDRTLAAPGLTLVSPGSEGMEGAGGALLHTAVEVAALRGAVSLLAERTDTGELVEPRYTYDSNPYSARTVRETSELIINLARLTDGPLIASGICLGGWALGAAAPVLPASVTRRLSLVIVNNVGWQRQPLRYWRQGVRSGPLAPTLPGENVAEESTSTPASPSQAGAAATARAVSGYVAATGRTVVRGVRRRAREASPRVTSLAATAGVIDVPQPLLRSLSKINGLSVDAVFGPEDAAFVGVQSERLGPNSRVSVVEDLDHSVLATASRRTLTNYILGMFPA